ncbi:hypothetical protein C7999DRAFT_29921 [Corynascus novoguineensis]|uniref:Uncharacterized protein n=1 Tax=Corynascus novoguineensis TaxID=1126955 RepID=A0AAN7CWN8_9PEZI|nr:hypothetical protein C7999DRAFT_29921 [Corynascus novoguineensis]
MSWDSDASSAVSVGSSGSSWAAATAAVPDDRMRRRHMGGGGVINAVLLLMVQFVLAGVQVAVVVQWVLGKVFDTLIWIVELGTLLLQPPH